MMLSIRVEILIIDIVSNTCVLGALAIQYVLNVVVLQRLSCCLHVTAQVYAYGETTFTFPVNDGVFNSILLW